MKRLNAIVAASAVFGFAAAYAAAQTPPAPTADPYANNARAGTLTFPLAAPAGKDSGALKKPLTGSVNTGAVDPSTWKYGPQNQVPGG
ncbi:MAG: hypothetical protein ACYCZX_11395, partial [Rhodospirillaceae bacterium]